MPLTTEQSLYKLQTWFSPSFPVGSYTYSHSLENAHDKGFINNVEQAVNWIEAIISTGNGFADAVFVCQAYRAVSQISPDSLKTIAEFATAFCATKELRLESESQGAAFVEVMQNVEQNEGVAQLIDAWSGPYPYSIAIGCAAGAIDIGINTTVTAYLHAFVSNLSSALVRIVPFGQTDGQRIIYNLASTVEIAAKKAQTTAIEDITTATMMVDLASMNHESQYTRLFRS